MKKNIAILLIYIVSIIYLNAQTQTLSTLDMLTSKAWILEHYVNNANENITYEKYNKEKIALINIWHGVTVNARNIPYYLSYEIEETFDSTKVGKIHDGIYMIMPCRIFIPSDSLAQKQLKEVEGVKLREYLKLGIEIEKSFKRGIINDSLIEKYKQRDNHRDTINGRWVTIPKIYKILKINQNEFIMQYIPKEGEVMIGGHPVRFIPYNDEMK